MYLNTFRRSNQFQSLIAHSEYQLCIPKYWCFSCVHLTVILWAFLKVITGFFLSSLFNFQGPTYCLRRFYFGFPQSQSQQCKSYYTTAFCFCQPLFLSFFKNFFEVFCFYAVFFSNVCYYIKFLSLLQPLFTNFSPFPVILLMIHILSTIMKYFYTRKAKDTKWRALYKVIFN